MGRTLFWHVISKDITHNQFKPICINLECEISVDESIDRLTKLLIEKKLPLHGLSAKAVAKEYYYHGNKDPSSWCEKCSLFIYGPLGYDKRVNEGLNPLV